MASDVEIVKVKPTWVEGIWKVVMLVLVAGNFFLAKSYVSKEIYDADREKINEQLQKLAAIIEVMQEAEKVNDRQDIELQDHEARLRRLEQAEAPSTKKWK